MLLELKHIYKNYLQDKIVIPVLKDVNISIDEGEYVAIMGPSGSGKTTLMNIIGCLDRPTKGEFLLEGESIVDYNENRLSDLRLNTLGFVFQSFQLMPRESALDNVSLPLSYAGVKKKERKERAQKALERVGLGDRSGFRPTQLSGGQKQRVAIARAMVNNPKILLADEPTGALDQKSGKQIMELFQSLNDEGVTIVMITHNPDIAAQDHGRGGDVKLFFSRRSAGPDKISFPQHFFCGVDQEQQIIHCGWNPAHNSGDKLEVDRRFQKPLFHKIGDVADHAHLIDFKLRLSSMFVHRPDIVLHVLEGVGEGHGISILHKGNLPIKLWLIDFVRNGREAEVD